MGISSVLINSGVSRIEGEQNYWTVSLTSTILAMQQYYVAVTSRITLVVPRRIAKHMNGFVIGSIDSE